MATTAPGSGPNLVNDAHYHAIAATAKWSAFIAGTLADVTNSAAKRAEERGDRRRTSTYAEGRLGGH